MVFLIVVAANYLLIRPLLGEKIAPLAEHKIFGNLFKNQFIYYVFEAFSIIYIVTSYFKARGSKEDQRVVAATAVMLSVGLLLTALLFKGKGLMIADFVLLFVLLALTLASLLIGCGVSKPVYFLFTACFAGGYALVYLALWRCPFCGRRLGRSDGESCPHCGKNLLSPGHSRT